MKRIEFILIGILLVGFLMNLFFLTGGGVLIMLSSLFLALLYYPGGLFLFNDLPFKGVFKRESYAGLTAMKAIVSVVAGIALSLICLGILFKLQSWPGSEVNLLVGLTMLLTVVLIAAYKFKATKIDIYKNILKRAGLFGIVGLGLYFISSPDIERFRYRNHPECLVLYEQYLLDPENPELWEQLDEAHHRIASRE